MSLFSDSVSSFSHLCIPSFPSFCFFPSPPLLSFAVLLSPLISFPLVLSFPLFPSLPLLWNVVLFCFDLFVSVMDGNTFPSCRPTLSVSPLLPSLYHGQSSSTRPLSESHGQPILPSSLAGQIESVKNTKRHFIPQVIVVCIIIFSVEIF